MRTCDFLRALTSTAIKACSAAIAGKGYMSEGGNNDIVDVAARLLEKYPLCDRCLGRMFAGLGRGLSNDERGMALKLAVAMKLHAAAKAGDQDAMRRLRRVLANSGPGLDRLYKELFNEEPQHLPCYICGGLLDEYLKSMAPRVAQLLRDYNVRTFLIGAKVSKDVIEKEEAIKGELGITYGESIKSEIKRELGKLVQSLGFTVDFVKPEGVATVTFPSGTVELQVTRLRIHGIYRRHSRGMPIRVNEEEKHPLIAKLVEVTGSSAAGIGWLVRDEGDSRVLGEGIPIYVSLSRPRVRDALRPGSRIEVEGAELTVMEVGVRQPQELRRVRIYRCIVHLASSVSDEALALASSSLSGKQVVQKVMGKSVSGKVHTVQCRLLASTAAECLIALDEQLYVKEFVSGLGSEPSLSSALRVSSECASLDLLGVEE